MRRLIALAAAMAAVAACSADGRAEEHDAGPDTSRTYEVGAFSKIKVAGPYDVAITTGGKPMAAASGSARLLDKTEVLVEGDTLVIRPRKKKGFGWSWSRGKASFTLSTAMLNAAAVAGSGDIRVDRVDGDFSGKVAGSGGIEVGAIKGGNAELEIAGSGSVRAAGTADQVTAKIAGSGDIDATGLAARAATVKIAGSGNVRARASDSAAVNIAGSGDVEVTGGAKCTVKKAGSGNVRCS